jgi:hypothetical protein
MKHAGKTWIKNLKRIIFLGDIHSIYSRRIILKLILHVLDWIYLDQDRIRFFEHVNDA